MDLAPRPAAPNPSAFATSVAMNPNDFLVGVLAPALLVGTLLLIAWGLAASAARADPNAPASAVAIAISLGALAGFGLLFGWEPQPRESWLWMIWVFPACAALAGLESRSVTTPAVRWLLRVALVGVAIDLVLRKVLWPKGGDLDFEKCALYFGVPLLVLGLWHAVIPRLGAALGALALWMMASGMAAMLLFANSFKLAQIGGTVAAGLGALIVACWLRPSPGGMAGAITPVAVLLCTLTFTSFEFASAKYSHWLFALVALAPLCAVLPLARKSLPRLCLIAIPILVAVVLAFATYDTSAY